jgi:hypothetical protein
VLTPPEAWCDALDPEVLAQRHARAAERVRGSRASWIVDSPWLFVAACADRADAVELAFSWISAREHVSSHHGAHRIGLSVGIGAGVGHGGLGAEASRAVQLAQRGFSGEVACSEAFVGAGNLPVGIGAFRAPEAREAQLGFGFHLLADYRG